MFPFVLQSKIGKSLEKEMDWWLLGNEDNRKFEGIKLF